MTNEFKTEVSFYKKILEGNFIDSLVYNKLFFLLSLDNDIYVFTLDENDFPDQMIRQFKVDSENMCYSLEAYNSHLYIFDGYVTYIYSIKKLLQNFLGIEKKLKKNGFNISVNNNGILFSSGVEGIDYYSNKYEKFTKIESTQGEEVQQIDSNKDKAVCNSDFNHPYILEFIDALSESTWQKKDYIFEDKTKIKYTTRNQYFILKEVDNSLYYYKNSQHRDDKEFFSFHDYKGKIIDASATKKLRIIELENTLVIARQSEKNLDFSFENFQKESHPGNQEISSWKTFHKSEVYNKQVHIIRDNDIIIIDTNNVN